MANLIKLRRGTKAQILSAAGSLAEPLYSWDTKELFIGNGTGANTPLVSATSADITYYVRTDGNDANTGLANTAGGAFKTIGKAISMIPQVVNHTVAVNVAAGTYAEDVIISGTNGAGYVAINGTSASIRSFTAARCNRIVVSGFTATSTTQSAFYAYDGGKCDFTSCIVIASNSNTGISFFNQRGLVEGCTISNRSVAIQVEKGQVTVINCGGTGNVTAILPSGGAIVNTAGTIMSGAINGSNGGVINPWGDNTASQRSIIWAFRAGSNQSVAANTFTKLIFDGKSTDNLGEYNVGTGTFTASKSGWYRIKSRVLLLGVSAGSIVYLRVIQNGAAVRDIGRDYASATGDLATTGDVLLYCPAGNTFSLEVYCATATSVLAGDQHTRLEIICEAGG